MMRNRMRPTKTYWIKYPTNLFSAGNLCGTDLRSHLPFCHYDAALVEFNNKQQHTTQNNSKWFKIEHIAAVIFRVWPL